MLYLVENVFNFLGLVIVFIFLYRCVILFLLVYVCCLMSNLVFCLVIEFFKYKGYLRFLDGFIYRC